MLIRIKKNGGKFYYERSFRLEIKQFRLMCLFTGVRLDKPF
jgi:hypothetical protein